MAERYLNHPTVLDEQRLGEWENIVRAGRVIKGFRAGKIQRKTFLSRMRKLGWQDIEALKMAEKWEDA